MNNEQSNWKDMMNMNILREKLITLGRMEEIADHAKEDYKREPENAEYEETFNRAYQNELNAYISAANHIVEITKRKISFDTAKKLVKTKRSEILSILEAMHEDSCREIEKSCRINNDVRDAMSNIEAAFSEELEHIIAFYKGSTTNSIIYSFNYTELNHTRYEQEKTIDCLKSFAKKHNGTANKEISTSVLNIEIAFPVEH